MIVADYVLTVNNVITISSIQGRIVLTTYIAVILTHLTLLVIVAYIVIAVVATRISIVNLILLVRTNSRSSLVSNWSLVSFRCHVSHRSVMSAIQMERTSEYAVTAIVITMMQFVVAAITKVSTVVTS